MTVTINGTTGISSDAGYSSDGVSFADGTPSNTLVTTTGGNVGIGTGSPTSYAGGSHRTLQIYNSASANAELRISNATTGTGASVGALIQQAGNDMYVWNASNSFMAFGTNNTERARIDSSGNVGIGTNSPSAPLHVSYTTEAGLRLANTSGTPSDWTFQTLNSGVLRFYSYTAGAERARIDSAGQFHTKDGAGNVKAAYDARAWVNFDGTLTGTITPRASGNVSSVTKNGTGDYTVNFTSAMPDVNYAWSGAAHRNVAGPLIMSLVAGGSFSTYQTTTSLRVISYQVANGVENSDFVSIVIFR